MKRAPATAPPSWSPIIIAALAPTVAAALYIHAAESTSLVQIIYFSSKALIFSFPAVWWLIVERRTRAASVSSRGCSN